MYEQQKMMFEQNVRSCADRPLPLPGLHQRGHLRRQARSGQTEGAEPAHMRLCAQTDLLILDDFGMKVLDGQQLLDFMEIIEDRHGQKATIIVSQLPVANWYDVMKGNTTAADAILDRLVHTSVRFELKGASMRQKSNIKSTETHRND